MNQMLQKGNNKIINWYWGVLIVLIVGIVNIIFIQIIWIELLWIITLLSVIVWNLEYGFKVSLIGQIFTTAFMIIIEWSTGDLYDLDYLSILLVIIAYNFIFTFVVGYAFSRIRTLLHEVNEHAIRDPLTKLYNRRMLEETSHSLLDSAKRKQFNIGVLALDLDHFKRVNDQYGHDNGDRILIEFSKIMLSNVRVMDYCYRIGGEEFLILLPDIDLTIALDIGERIRKRISESTIIIEEQPVNITVSIGVHLSDEQDTDLGEMLKRADEALYSSKQTGRNKVTII